MATKIHAKETEILEKWRTSLENVTSQPTVAAAMDELGYTPDQIVWGKAIYGRARSTYDSNRQESDEANAAHKVFETEAEVLDSIYSIHRKKAKVVFRNDASAARELDIHVALSEAYTPWMESVKKFYLNLSANEVLRTGLSKLKVTSGDIAAAELQIGKVEKARAAYVRELGESKDSTTLKDAAFAEAEKWMRDFYAVARIALEDRPQLYATLFK
jgi:hypothetical protein